MFIRYARGLVIVGAIGASAGCAKSVSGGAQEAFSQSFTCPIERVVVTPRPDIPPHTLFGHQADGTDATPPADIAADPGRLQMWQEEQAKKAAAIDDLGPVYEVNGCGKKAMLLCFHPTKLDIAAGNGVVVGNLTTTSNDSVVSAVECVSGQGANNGKLGLGLDGLKVGEVRVGSPAALAGFVTGDVIVAVDHQPVSDPNQVVQMLRAPDPAGHVVTVQRADGLHDLTIAP